MGKEKRVNCLKCKHFYITWEPDYPRGCKFLGFKSKQYPSDVVLKESGEICLSFSEKPKKKY
jgi:hypothetical protein